MSSANAAVVASNPVERLATLPDGYPQRTLGEIAAEWAEANLIQPNGPRAGKPFRLTMDQYRFLLWWYALDSQGQWLYNHGARRLAKGSGKSPFAAVLALIEFLAPVRLERFDSRLPGGCRGRTVDMPWVQVAATAESQTANTMRMVRAFCPKRGPLADEYKIDVGKTRYYKMPEGTLEVITSSFTAAEGAEVSFVVADETEHWKPSNGGPEMMATLEDNLAKSDNRLLQTSNAWEPGLETVAEATWEAWILQEEGHTRGDSRILYDTRTAPPGTDMADPDSLRSALEWVYGDCDWKKPNPADEDCPPDVRPVMERIWSPRSRPDDSMRKYLNWPTVANDSWTTPQEWALLSDTDRQVADSEQVVLGFDGSLSRDATALIGCCVSDGHVFTAGVWEPDRSGVNVSAVAVDAAVALAFNRYDVAGFFGDVREWESFVKISWPTEHGDSLQVQAVPGGKDPQAIAWDMRSHTGEFTRECELVLAEIEAGEFTHDGNPVLARHVANARRSPNRWGVSISKESPDSPRKIDAAVAMVMARMVRRRLLAAPEKKSKKPGRVVSFS